MQVQLTRQMERSHKEFQQWRKQREMEVIRLKKQVPPLELLLLSVSTGDNACLHLQVLHRAQRISAVPEDNLNLAQVAHEEVITLH